MFLEDGTRRWQWWIYISLYNEHFIKRSDIARVLRGITQIYLPSYTSHTWLYSPTAEHYSPFARTHRVGMVRLISIWSLWLVTWYKFFRTGFESRTLSPIPTLILTVLGVYTLIETNVFVNAKQSPKAGNVLTSWWVLSAQVFLAA